MSVLRKNCQSQKLLPPNCQHLKSLTTVFVAFRLAGASNSYQNHYCSDTGQTLYEFKFVMNVKNFANFAFFNKPALVNQMNLNVEECGRVQVISSLSLMQIIKKICKGKENL